MLDLEMPVMDGWHALPHLRRVPPTSHIIVFSSTTIDARLEKRLTNLGASRFVPNGGDPKHAGGLLVQGLCDKLGLTDAITRVFGLRGLGTIPRGAVMRDLATAIADGGDAVIAVEALRSQAAAFGPVASDTTVWRTLGELDEARRHEFRRMLGAARELRRRVPPRPPRATPTS